MTIAAAPLSADLAADLATDVAADLDPDPGVVPGGPPDPHTLALGALGWVLAERARGDRLLALTGLTPAALRAGLGDPPVLGAVLDFLLGHEADLIAAAAALGVAPAAFAAARERLG